MKFWMLLLTGRKRTACSLERHIFGRHYSCCVFFWTVFFAVKSYVNRKLAKKKPNFRNSGNQTKSLEFTGNAFKEILANYRKPTFRIKSYFISLFLSEEKCSVFQKLIKCRVQEYFFQEHLFCPFVRRITHSTLKMIIYSQNIKTKPTM